MSQTTISFKLAVDGVLTDATSVVLSDPTGAFGVKRTDTGAVVVADGTAMTKDGVGLYSHTFTDPASGLVYSYWIEFVYLGATYRIERSKSGTAAAQLNSYLNAGPARDLAAELPATHMAAVNAATDDALQAALNQASIDVDAAGPYQGRRYDADQVREFPRIDGDRLVDEDAAGEAVVPTAVLLAVLHQANSILADKRRKRLEARHDGVVSQGVGSLNEAYDGEEPELLCMQAARLMRRYELSTGRIL